MKCITTNYRAELSLTTNSPLDRERLFAGDKPQEALRIIAKLRESGFVAYLAGGCVRDALLGQQPKDYDVATDATPDSVREVFGRRNTLAFGASFGVIGVLPARQGRDAGTAPIEPTEVATFRSDGTYSDGRRPDSVHYGNAENDALRRDFTINGLFFDPSSNEVIDYVGGQEDLRAGTLRTIGPATQRFDEDKLRMLRAIRFATTLGFRLHEATLQAIVLHADMIAVVSGERIGAEMRRILVSPAGSEGLVQLQQTGLHRTVLPELTAADDKRLAAMLGQLPTCDFPSALACLLLSLPAPIAALRAIKQRWKLSNDECRMVQSACQYWQTIARSDALPWSAVQPRLIDRDAATMVNVAAAVVAAAGDDAGGIQFARDALAWPREQLDPPPLLTGDDLRELNIPVGSAYRTILKTVRDSQLDGKIASRDEAIRIATTQLS